MPSTSERRDRPEAKRGRRVRYIRMSGPILRFSSGGPSRVEKDGPFDDLARDQNPRLLPRVAAK